MVVHNEKAICVSVQLSKALSISFGKRFARASSRGTHHGHLGMSTTTSLAPTVSREIGFDDGAQ